MISLAQLKTKAERMYWRVLKSHLQGQPVFPLDIPADKQLPGPFETLRQAIGELVENAKNSKRPGYRLTFAERQTRRHGRQSVPVRITFDTLDDFLFFIRKKMEAGQIFQKAVEISQAIPKLSQWAASHPRKIFKYLDEWTGIIEVLRYFQDNPKPGKYVRELPIDVHTKFVEHHKGILRELLEILIPGAIDWRRKTFEHRFHLKIPEPLIRMRRLDAAIDGHIFTLADDLALPASAFNRLVPQSKYIVIVENQMTYITLPALPQTIGIYGGGFNVEILKNAAWLMSRRIIYWGDIDEHGFLILSLVRRYYPNTVSIMMDVETLSRFRDRTGQGPAARQSDESSLNLTPEENELFQEIKKGNHRLEQEHLPQPYIASRFQKLIQ
jgi:hypothetical protein